MSVENILQNSRMHELGIAHMFLSRNVGSFHQAALKKYGLTAIEWFMLCVIDDATKEGGIRVTDLAGVFEVRTTYVTSVLNSLRAKGYVETRFDASDARVRLAIVTSKGSKEVPVIEHYIQKEIGRLLDGAVEADEFATYLRVVKKIAELDTAS